MTPFRFLPTHFRTLRSALIPVSIVGIPVLAFLVLQFRALDRFEARTTQVLSQGSEQLATRIASRIEDDFKSPLFNFLEQIDHTAVRELELEEIEVDLLANVDYGALLDTFFIWSNEANSNGGGVLFYSMSPDGSRSERVGFYEDKELSQELLERVGEFSELGSTYGLVYKEVEGQTTDLVYHLLFALPESNKLDAFMGFTVNSTYLLENYFAPMIAEIRAEETSLAGIAPLEVSIFDHHVEEVYRSGQSLSSTFETEVSFPFFFFDVDLIRSLRWFTPEVRYWTVRTGYPEASAAALARQQVNQQRLLWLLVALVAVAGMLLTVRATVREHRLAEMKSAFVSSVSHDLKTPLASIKLFAETLETGRVNGEARAKQYGQVIGTEAVRLERLIAGILDFERMESGTAQYPIEETDLSAVVREAVSAFDNQLSQRNFRTELIVPPNKILVKGNRDGLTHVFENLISNAIKYSSDDRFLRIELRHTGTCGVVEITDHGVGIAAKDQKLIFRKFHRVVENGSTGETGTGIGLSIVEHIVRALNGKLSLESIVGQGSTFTVELPLAEGGAT